MTGPKTLVEHFVPTEIWHSVFPYLPNADKRTCLSVSPLFNALALSYLFSTVKLYFGDYDISGRDEASEDLDDDQRAMEERTYARSWELLDRIINDPHFSKVVKKLIIYPFAKGGMIFEQQTLVKAFRVLPQLKSFHWMCIYPDISSSIVDGLESFCPNLEELSVPAMSSFSNLRLSRLSRLRSFILDYSADIEKNLDVWTIEKEGLQPGCSREVTDFVSDHGRLQKLSIHAPLALTLSADKFCHADDIRIWSIPNAELMEHVLSNAPNLRHVSLEWGEANHEIIQYFLIHSPPFPQLRSLRLAGPGMIHPLAFSARLPVNFTPYGALRRLDFSLDLPNFVLWDCLRQLNTLPRLEVLGLNLMYWDWCEDFFQSISLHLPLQLHALRIALPMETGELNDAKYLYEKLREMPNLTFLYLSSDPSVDVIVIREFINDYPTLKVLGVNKYMWTIDRYGEDVDLIRWSDTKLIFRCPEDFEDEDAAWLMKSICMSDFVEDQ